MVFEGVLTARSSPLRSRPLDLILQRCTFMCFGGVDLEGKRRELTLTGSSKITPAFRFSFWVRTLHNVPGFAADEREASYSRHCSNIRICQIGLFVMKCSLFICFVLNICLCFMIEKSLPVYSINCMWDVINQISHCLLQNLGDLLTLLKRFWDLN